MKKNYQMILEETLRTLQQENYVPDLLLHSCCGPCSTYVLEYLSRYFRIHVYYYNPNIYPSREYTFREKEQRRLVENLNTVHPIRFHAAPYDPAEYYDAVIGHEEDPEGGPRCAKCYELRLREAARAAREMSFSYFTTTLSISPHKNAQLLNEIGGRVGDEYGVQYLFSDFKKKGGFQRSVELTAEQGMYRQDYCGCVFSMQSRKEPASEK